MGRQPDDTEPVQYEQPEELPPGTRYGLVALVAACTATVLVAVVVWVFGGRGANQHTSVARQEVRPAPKSPGTAVKPAAANGPLLPYPESKTCWEWLQENVGDPKSIEVISWEKAFDQSANVIRIKYRAKNDRGVTQVFKRKFYVGNDDGRISATSLEPLDAP
jgi:hypothetical protein